MPKVSASSGVTRPRGMGRLAVRCMQASMSASYHMLSAPDAPAPTAMQISAMTASTGCDRLRRQHHADERREHHQRHHAWLHQGDEVADAAARLSAAERRGARLDTPSVSHGGSSRFSRGCSGTASVMRRLLELPAASRRSGRPAARAASTRAWWRRRPRDCSAAFTRATK